jgi:hypothetical protein
MDAGSRESGKPSDGTSLPRPAKDVVAKRVGDDVLLVHLQTNKIYELNRTAGRMWTLLEEGLSREEIEARLADEFAVDRETVRAEMDGAIDHLLGEKLLLPDG